MRLVCITLGITLLGCAGLTGEEEDDDGGGLFGGTDEDTTDGEGDDEGQNDDDDDGLTNDEESDLGTDPDEADSDGDGTDDGAEIDADTDPLDEGDKPYAGGWEKGSCRADIEGEGWDVGDVSENWSLPDQNGEDVFLHDFCDKTVLVIFSAFW